MIMQLMTKIDALTMSPHPPSAQSPSLLSPRTRNQGHAHTLSRFPPQVVTGNHGGSSSSSSSSSNGVFNLLPSNANGKDSSGYSVGTRCDLKSFLVAISSVPLGSIKDKNINWITPNWKTVLSADKVAASRNTEAKKIMELVLHIATEDQVKKMFSPLPADPIELASALDDKRSAMDSVIVRVMEFLEEHEKLVPKSKPTSSRQAAPKVSTTGALCRRWCNLQYTKKDPKLIEAASSTIQPWAAAGMVLCGTATGAATSSSDSLNTSEAARKRSRVDH